MFRTNNGKLDYLVSASLHSHHSLEAQKSLVPPSSSGNYRTEILHGAEAAVGRGVEFMANVKRKMDLCYDYRARR